MRRKRTRRSYKRVIIIAVFILVAIIGVVMGQFGRMGNRVSDSGLEVASNQSHIMLMGVDRRQDDAGRSDTLMVLTVDTEKEKGSIMSIPRDTRVRIEGHGYDKINHAYPYGGHKLTRSTVEELLGVPMDYYVLVDIHAFERIIDALDGIDINVEKRMYYEDPWDDDGGLVIDLYPGMQHMDGEQAIQYVRYRDGEGDIGRIRRQQHFMRAVMEKVLTPSIIGKLPSIIREIRDGIETDMPFDEMLSMANLLPTMKENGIAGVMLPGKPAYLDDVSYWLPDIVEVRKLVADQLDQKLSDKALMKAEEELSAYDEDIPEGITVLEDPDKGKSAADKPEADDKDKKDQKDQKEETDGKKGSEDNASLNRDETDDAEKDSKASQKAEGPGDISVLIINDSGINGAGAKVADMLKAKGFNVTGVDTGSRSDREHTIIITDDSNTAWFYGMPFDCTIMDGEEDREAVVYIGKDLNL